MRRLLRCERWDVSFILDNVGIRVNESPARTGIAASRSFPAITTGALARAGVMPDVEQLDHDQYNAYDHHVATSWHAQLPRQQRGQHTSEPPLAETVPQHFPARHFWGLFHHNTRPGLAM